MLSTGGSPRLRRSCWGCGWVEITGQEPPQRRSTIMGGMGVLTYVFYDAMHVVIIVVVDSMYATSNG